jgi:hypothetical protein
MQRILIVLALSSVLGITFVACGPETASSATSTTGAGGAPNCDGVHLDTSDKDGTAPCNTCLHKNCCAEIAGCRDATCLDCANFPRAGCSQVSITARKCADDLCLSTCAPGWPPSTSSGSSGGAGGAGDAGNSSTSSG